MSRRCISGACQLAAARKSRTFSLNLPVANILYDPAREWSLISRSKGKRVASQRNIDLDWGKIKVRDHLYTHCFVPGMRVLMADGTYKAIEEVKVGDFVISHTGASRRVRAISKRPYSGIVFDFKFSGVPNTVSVTPEHPFYAVKVHKTCVCGCGASVNCKRKRSFVLGHQNRVYGSPHSPDYAQRLDQFRHDLDSFEWRDSCCLDVGDYVALGIYKSCGVNVGSDMARLLGYYLAEGWVSQTSCRQASDYGVFNRIFFAFSGDEEEYVTEVCSILERLTGAKPHIADRRPDSNCVVIDVKDKVLADKLLALGGSKCYGKRIAREVFDWDLAEQRELLACWFRGDSGVTVSQTLAEQAQIVASNCGIESNLYRRPKHRKRTEYTLKIMPSFIAKNSEEFGFENWVGKSTIVVADKVCRRRKVAGRVVTRVNKKGVSQYEGYIHNLSVEEDESYVVEGVATHNCTIVCSVETEDNGYYIKSPCDELVNSNANAWSNPVLLSTFRSFIGAYNYYEHVQIPELSKGRVIDAVLRPVVYEGKKGGKANVWYCDILVQTDRIHIGLCRRIASGELSTLSMGCHLDGTLVRLADGTQMCVEDVPIGASVVTHTGGVGTVESKRRRLCSDGELRRLSLVGRPDTYVTKEHPYWTLRGYDKCKGCGKELPRGRAGSLDTLMREWCSSSCYQTHCNTNPKVQSVAVLQEQHPVFEWVAAEELRVGDFVAVPLGRPEQERTVWAKSRCRLLGLYAADGNLQKDEHSLPRAVEFTFSQDEGYLVDDVKSCVDAEGIELEKVYVQSRNRECGKSTRVVVHNSDLAVWLQSMCGEHCDMKRFSSEVLLLDDESLCEIIGAYIDGDGHCRVDDSRFTTVSTSPFLSQQVLTMLRFVGVPASVSGPYKMQDRKPFWHVNTRKSWAIRLEGYTRKFRQQPVSKERISCFDGYMLVRVKANDPVGGCYFVNNLHVVNDAGDHSFIAGDVAVHNCVAEILQCSRCGHESLDDNDECEHVRHQLGEYFKDENGVRRIVAELCGRSYIDPVTGKRVGDPTSVRFIEASWVESPAFRGAVINHLVSIGEDSQPVLVSAGEYTGGGLRYASRVRGLRVADCGGMMAVRLAREELRRQHLSDIAERIVQSALD